jgi:phosphopentomutase
MPRAIILVLDSFGIGSTPDASTMDKGANTFGHIAAACASGQADKKGVREGALHIPHLSQLGLVNAALRASPMPLSGVTPVEKPLGAYGFAAEKSFGKDTPSGHWEMAGVPVLFDWGYFPETEPCFPEALIQQFMTQNQLIGVLGNKHASGTEIIKEFGEEHIRTGKPIVYTSADSVFQIAAHETYFGLERLYAISTVARKLVDPYHIGRVIARPFIGEVGSFERTFNRKDYATPPPELTLLDEFVAQQGEVIAIGKIADIFAHRGITQTVKAGGNDSIFEATLQALKTSQDNTLIFSNFVDFDMLYGHRRDVIGYAHALEQFDKRLPELMKHLQPDDLVIISADHGCDPTWMGTDHTREYVPILAFGPNIPAGYLGKRQSFADIGQSIATHLNIRPLKHGQSFIHPHQQWEFTN